MGEVFDDASSIGLAKHQYVSHGNGHAMAYGLADDDPGCTGPKDVQ